ncbi:MAG: hypothetical protein Tsb0020_38920 [Haliangiales bacterium]
MLRLTLTPAASGTKLDATLENTGDTPMLVNTRLGVSRPQRGGELFLQVLTSDGSELPFTARVNIGRPSDAHFEELAPGQSVTRSFDLSMYFQVRNYSGTLQIIATYANQAGPEGQPAWQGEVKAAPVSITLP